MRSRQISAASARNCRQTPATLLLGSQSRRAGSPQYRWLCGDRPSQRRRCWHGQGRGPRRAVLNAAGQNTDPRRGYAEKIKAGGHASPYRLRKQLPEPVFGQIKQARGFRQFLMRGIDKVRAEWAIVCTAHNLLKLAHRRNLSAALPLAAVAA